MTARLFTPRGLWSATTWADRALCVALIAFSFLLPALVRPPSEGPAEAIVTVGRTEVLRLPLDRYATRTVQGRLGPVRLEVRGYGAGGCPAVPEEVGAPLVSRIARTGFLPHARLQLPMFLARSCAAMWEACEAAGRTCDPCPGGDCTLPGCVEPEIDPASLAPVRRAGE